MKKQLKAIVSLLLILAVVISPLTSAGVWTRAATELTITQQPTDVTVASGSIAKTTVAAEGEGLSYQWWFANAGASAFSKASITTATYSVEMNSTRANRRIYCVITDANGKSVTTDTVTLGMTGYIVVNEWPESVAVENGEAATVSVGATGKNLKYQWWFANAGTSVFKKASITAPVYSVEMDATRAGRKLYCEITDASGNVVKTNTVTIDLYTPLEITKQPESVRTVEGNKATVSVGAVGDGLTYQWWFANAGSNVFSKSSIATASYSTIMDSTRAGRRLHCIITDKYGNTVQTDTVTIDMASPVAIVEQPESVAVEVGETATVSVAAEGDGLTYQWWFANAGTSVFKKASITAPVYSVEMDATRAGRKLYCVVTDKYGFTAKSNTVTIGIYTPMVITKQPESVTVAGGSMATVSVAATGDDLSYQWWFANADSTKYSKASIVTATYSVEMTDARNGRSLYCVITDAYGNTMTTDTVTISMAAPVVVIRQPEGVAVEAGEQAVVSVTAEGEGLSYQWWFANAGATKFSKASITGPVYSVEMDSTRAGRRIYCVITDKYGQSVQTRTVALDLYTPLEITEQPTDVIAANGTKAYLSVSAVGDGLTYQWWFANAGSDKFTKSSVATSTYATVMDSSKDGRRFYCIVTDQYGNSVQSDVATVSLPIPVAIVEQPMGVTVAEGATASVSVYAEGEGLTYQWWFANAGANKFSKASITGPVYSVTMDSTRDGRMLYCVVTDEYGNTATSDIVTINMFNEEAPTITIWTWTSDIEIIANRYAAETGVNVEVVYTADTLDLMEKYEEAFAEGSSEVDIIIGEPGMMQTYFDNGWCVDLGEYAEAGQFDQLIDYIVETGTDDDGAVKAISYQATPGGIVYRRDIAQEVFGVSEPEDVHELVKDFDSILSTARELKETDEYIMFNSSEDLSLFAGMNTSWIGADGKAHISDLRYNYLDLTTAFYEEELHAFNNSWTSIWYEAMGNPIPKNLKPYSEDGSIWGINVESEEYEQMKEENGTYEVFAYSFPTWGAIFLNTYAGDTYGNWGVCEGPCPYTWGGTYLGISENSDSKQDAWDFLEYCCLNKDTSIWWSELMNDFVAYEPALEELSENEYDLFGGQQIIKTWSEIAEKFDPTVSSVYDADLSILWDSAISNYNSGYFESFDQAVTNFWLDVAAIYPELIPDDVVLPMVVDIEMDSWIYKEGDTVEITANVSNPTGECTYEWWYMEWYTHDNYVNAGVNSPVFNLEIAPGARDYSVYCVVTDSAGNVAESSHYGFYVSEANFVFNQPTDAWAKLGEIATVEVEAFGLDDNLTYEWWFAEAGSDTFKKSTTMFEPVYSVEMTEARAGRRLYCVITDSEGNSLQTDIVTLHLISGAISDDTLTILTWTSDIELFANRFMQETGADVEIIYVSDTNDLLNQYGESLGNQLPDIDVVLGEEYMLDDVLDNGWCADLTEFTDASEFDKLYDFVVDVGTDDNGVVRALSYNANVGGIFYRRDIAQEVFGVSEPEDVQELFKDYDTMLETARTLDATGKYYLFNDTSDLGQFDDMNTSWIGSDGKIELTDARIDYMDTAYAFYNEGLIAFNSAWSPTWYGAMGGPIPANIAEYAADGSIWSIDINSPEYAEMLAQGTIEGFAYAFPTWGSIFLNSYAGETAGDWGICQGPSPYIWGGTWMGVSEYSDAKDLAWQFVEYCCLNEDSANWWIDLQGDFVALKSANESHFDDASYMFGGQNIYRTWDEMAKNVDASSMTEYDRDITSFWDGACSMYNTGTMTKDEAINDFWLQVSTMYPELIPDDLEIPLFVDIGYFNHLVRVGDSVDIPAVAGGGSGGYTFEWWYKVEDYNSESEFINAGVSSSVFTFQPDPVPCEYVLYCVVTDSEGNTARTEYYYWIGVSAANFVILIQPADTYAALNEEFVVQVDTITNDELTYEWWFAEAGSDTFEKSTVSFSETYSATMTEEIANGRLYCVITDEEGNSIQSDIVTLYLID